jgi:hypothetical protein
MTRTKAALLSSIPVALAAVGFALVGGGCGGKTPGGSGRRDTGRSGVEPEVTLPRFNRSDWVSVRGDLEKLNAYQAKKGSPTGTVEDRLRTWLRSGNGLRLTEAELAEVESQRYTLLDSYYLDLCFLVRDAARFLDAERLSAEKKAELAFAWVCRELRLTGRPEADVLPPQYALRRGIGTPLERALSFLGVLGQLGVEGCLVDFPGPADKPYTVAGVIAKEDGRAVVYLFDPHLGMPLPGPKGKGVATLETVRGQKELLEPFAAGKEYRVGTTPARVRLVCSLSSLAPRMKYLQDQVLKGEAKARLATDPLGLLARCKEAVKAQGGKEDAVEFWREGSRVVRAFLPPEEGGADSTKQRLARFYQTLIPPRAMPPELDELPPDKQVKELVQLHLFGRMFAGLFLDPDMPRDEMLRGRTGAALDSLVKLRDQLPNARAMIDADFRKNVKTWVDTVKKVYAEAREAEDRGAPADAARSQLRKLMQDGQKLWVPFLEGKTADLRMEVITYLIALCMQEQAEKAQAQLLRAGARATRQEKESAQKAWTEARSWWQTYLQEHPNHPGRVAGSAFLARVREAQGDRKEAATLLEDTPNTWVTNGWLTPLEQAARRYRARQLQDAK